MARPTNRKWVSSPQFCLWTTCPHLLIPLKSPGLLIPPQRFVGWTTKYTFIYIYTWMIMVWRNLWTPVGVTHIVFRCVAGVPGLPGLPGLPKGPLAPSGIPSAEASRHPAPPGIGSPTRCPRSTGRHRSFKLAIGVPPSCGKPSHNYILIYIYIL